MGRGCSSNKMLALASAAIGRPPPPESLGGVTDDRTAVTKTGSGKIQRGQTLEAARALCQILVEDTWTQPPQHIACRVGCEEHSSVPGIQQG